MPDEITVKAHTRNGREATFYQDVVEKITKAVMGKDMFIEKYGANEQRHLDREFEGLSREQALEKMQGSFAHSTVIENPASKNFKAIIQDIEELIKHKEQSIRTESFLRSVTAPNR